MSPVAAPRNAVTIRWSMERTNRRSPALASTRTPTLSSPRSRAAVIRANLARQRPKQGQEREQLLGHHLRGCRAQLFLKLGHGVGAGLLDDVEAGVELGQGPFQGDQAPEHRGDIWRDGEPMLGHESEQVSEQLDITGGRRAEVVGHEAAEGPFEPRLVEGSGRNEDLHQGIARRCRVLAVEGDEELRTMAFTTIVLAQLFNCFNARSDRVSAFQRLFTNWLLWGAVALSLLLQVAVVYLPFLNKAFDTTPLDAANWLLCTAMASTVLWADELRKMAKRRRRRPDRPETATEARRRGRKDGDQGHAASDNWQTRLHDPE